MVLPWEHEVRWYPGSLDGWLDTDADELGVRARCTCGQFDEVFPAGIADSVTRAAVDAHTATHPQPPPPDPEVIRELAHVIVSRGGQIEPAECRFCHALLRARGPLPDWAPTSPDERWPALWCPENPATDDPDTIPTHMPARITERTER